MKGTPWEAILLEGLKQLSPINRVPQGHASVPADSRDLGLGRPLRSIDTDVLGGAGPAGGQCELYTVQGGGHGVRWWESSHLTAYKQMMVHWLEKQLAEPGPRV